MITNNDIDKKVICKISHNGYVKGRTYTCTEGMIFSAPENWEVKKTKFNLLNAFENEYKEAFRKQMHEASGKFGTELTEEVIDKYMDMDTDLFDSDDLNEIIDRVAEKILG